MNKLQAIERAYSPCPNAYSIGLYADATTLAAAGVEGDEAEWWALDGEDEQVWLIRSGNFWRVANDSEYIAIFDNL